VSLLPDPDNIWFYVAAIAAWLVLGCLRIIGFEYYNAVLWHNLKIQVHNLRRQQQQRLRELQTSRKKLPAAAPAQTPPAVEMNPAPPPPSPEPGSTAEEPPPADAPAADAPPAVTPQPAAVT